MDSLQNDSNVCKMITHMTKICTSAPSPFPPSRAQPIWEICANFVSVGLKFVPRVKPAPQRIAKIGIYYLLWILSGSGTRYLVLNSNTGFLLKITVTTRISPQIPVFPLFSWHCPWTADVRSRQIPKISKKKTSGNREKSRKSAWSAKADVTWDVLLRLKHVFVELLGLWGH